MFCDLPDQPDVFSQYEFCATTRIEFVVEPAMDPLPDMVSSTIFLACAIDSAVDVWEMISCGYS
jgi:hypothetical protein